MCYVGNEESVFVILCIDEVSGDEVVIVFNVEDEVCQFNVEVDGCNISWEVLWGECVGQFVVVGMVVLDILVWGFVVCCVQC